jgi:purine-nucleoside phosphorylase
MKKVITPIAQKALLDAGFSHMLSFGRALAHTFVKTYESINGTCEAVIHIHEARGNFLFSGEFHSEGRNVLLACSGAGFIPCEIDNPEKLVAKYIADAERAVRESYAVRLFGGNNGNR